MIHLAFRRAGSGLFSRLIKWRTNGQFSHVEIAFGEPSTATICFSSDEADGGTRFKAIDLTARQWTCVPVHGIDAELLRSFCVRQDRKPYDFRTILRYWLGWGKDAAGNKWFCSEVCISALQDQGVFRGITPARTAPEDLWIAAMSRLEAWRP